MLQLNLEGRYSHLRWAGIGPANIPSGREGAAEDVVSRAFRTACYRYSSDARKVQRFEQKERSAIRDRGKCDAPQTPHRACLTDSGRRCIVPKWKARFCTEADRKERSAWGLLLLLWETYGPDVGLLEGAMASQKRKQQHSILPPRKQQLPSMDPICAYLRESLVFHNRCPTYY